VALSQRHCYIGASTGTQKIETQDGESAVESALAMALRLICQTQEQLGSAAGSRFKKFNCNTRTEFAVKCGDAQWNVQQNNTNISIEGKESEYPH